MEKLVMVNQTFTPNGIIDKNGNWFSCDSGHHIQTMLEVNNGPYAEIVRGETVRFESFYTCNHTLPTKAQFETLLQWCTAMGETFEDMTDCFCQPWENWRA